MFQPEKIIIADDHPLFRQALLAMLKSHFEGVIIYEAETVAQLNDLLAQFQDIDLLLLDLNIPGAQGFNTLINIRNTYQEMGVIVVSGYEDKETVAKSISHGAAGFIPKSTTVPDMLIAIEQVLAGNVWLPEDKHCQELQHQSEINEKISSLTPQQ